MVLAECGLQSERKEMLIERDVGPPRAVLTIMKNCAVDCDASMLKLTPTDVHF